MKILDRGIIFDATQAPIDARSCAFTSLARLSDGSLLVGFRIGTGRDTPDGRLRVMRSPDEGHTWQTLQAGLNSTIDAVTGNFYSGYFTELAPGRMLGTFLWVDRSDPSLSFVNPATAGILPTQVLLSESADGGRHWADFRILDLAPHTGNALTGPVWRLPDGILALPYESWKEYDDPSPGDHGANLRLSQDEGQSWTGLATVAQDRSGRYLYWDQRITTHPRSGQLAAMFWTHDRIAGQDTDIHIAWGSADGTSWSIPTPTGLPGQHCEPIAIGDDRLVAVYVHRKDPPSLRAVLSADFGKSWDRSTELVFYDSRLGTEPGFKGERAFEEFWQDMMAWRFGHPRGILLPDGDLFVAFYAGDGKANSMHWVRIGL
ncbi:MAG: exo-alpha-sialidase [Chloroflexi bacterium]|nr:exo-alpha-sialidase [Chloroflexota bacterium]